MEGTIYGEGLDRNPANYQPLTPLKHLQRAAMVFPDHVAIIHGSLRRSYGEFYARSRKLASALQKAGVERGDTVAAMLSNTPPMLEAHHGVPMAARRAAVDQHTARRRHHRLPARSRRGEGGDGRPGISGVMAQALAGGSEPACHQLRRSGLSRRRAVSEGRDDRVLEYEDFIADGDPDFDWAMPEDEWDAISLNYTSGTTGNPKGVVYHHRGAALMGYANVIASGMAKHPVYLWTLPMFHCNGWCFPWTLAVQAGTHVCLRWVRARAMYDAIADHGVTHLCGAPIVMSTLLNAPDAEKRDFDQTVTFNTAAAPPPESVLAGMADAGFEVTHLYGLTETYGPAVPQRVASAVEQAGRAGGGARRRARACATRRWKTSP
jgi:fatty-acyl-CoA synthase